MLDFLFTGWGAFWMTLIMLAPFAAIFYYIVHRKSVVDTSPSSMPRKEFTRIEGIWLATVFVVFIGINLASLKFMPTIAAAHAATSGKPITEINLTATSWAYDISNRKIEAGSTVRVPRQEQRVPSTDSRSTTRTAGCCSR